MYRYKSIFGRSDSPLLTTGFANVAREIYKGLAEEFDFQCFSSLDSSEPIHGELPYTRIPCNPSDPTGIDKFSYIAAKTKPDIIFLITEPGSMSLQMESLKRAFGSQKMSKVVNYCSVEGTPIGRDELNGFKFVEETGGRTIFWNKISLNKTIEQLPSLKHREFIYFGLDHADFKKYSDESRQELRKAVGFNKKFVIGSIGINKRTKGFADIIYLASRFKNMEDVVFYLHTDPCDPTMGGQMLHDLVEYYDVKDKIIFKPKSNKERHNHMYKGISYIKNLPSLKTDESLEYRSDVLSSYDYISRLNCLDIYLDLSQLEGWGLPLGEAMKCGVPCLSISDGFVRDEVYANGVYKIEPLPKDLWATLSTGARLVTHNPDNTYAAIMKVYKSKNYRDELSILGQKETEKYTWDKTRASIVSSIKEVLDND